MNTLNIQLTDTEKSILNSYKLFVNNLGSYLGEGYEIILHSLDNLDKSVISIYNGHYSGRKVGSPITNFALSMLSKINNNEQHDMISYFNTSKNGEKLKSCTIPIMGEKNNVIGLFCMNFYLDTPLSDIIQHLFFNLAPQNQSDTMKETFTENVDELIAESLNVAINKVLQDDTISQQNKNKEIIKSLYDQGIFNLKDAVIKVADLLDISKNTVYMHIRNLK